MHAGCDAFFLLMSRHSIMKLEVCCHHAETLCDFTADVSQSLMVKKFTKRHLKVLNMIELANSIYKYMNLGQLLTALGLFVVVTFQTRFGVDYILSIIFTCSMLQLFFYCYLSDRVYSMVKFCNI